MDSNEQTEGVKTPIEVGTQVYVGPLEILSFDGREDYRVGTNRTWLIERSFGVHESLVVPVDAKPNADVITAIELMCEIASCLDSEVPYYGGHSEEERDEAIGLINEWIQKQTT